jgi:hypothetical protein
MITVKVPYPTGFYAKGLDGRIDDPNAGWKGRGLWTSSGDRAPWMQEGGKGMKPMAVHFQLRPDPLAPPCGILSLRLPQARSMRPARNGAVPPACDQMNRISGYLAACPLHIRLMMARGRRFKSCHSDQNHATKRQDLLPPPSIEIQAPSERSLSRRALHNAVQHRRESPAARDTRLTIWRATRAA